MTRVAIVDDHGLFRAGVRAELEGHVELVGEASSVEDAVALVCAQRPDVVLLDVHMPDGGGVAVIHGSTDDAPDTLFLALSASDAAEDVIATIRAGARGYVTKNIATEELLDAIDRVQSGDAVFSPRLAGFVLDAGRVADELDVAFELGADAGAEQPVVVDDGDAGHAVPGSVSSTSVPAPGSEWIAARPPWRAMRPTIDSRTPRRSAGTVAGSKPGPRSRTKTCSAPSDASA